MSIQSINPTTGEVLATFNAFTPAQVEQALAETAAAFATWRQYSIAERGDQLRRVAGHLRENTARYAQLISVEMGKPITQSEAEISKCAWACDFYAGHAAGFLTPRRVQTNAYDSEIVFEPLGVLLAVMPWNFPFWQLFRFAAPALMVGNTFVLKHSANVPQCALAIEAVFREADLPPGVCRTLLIPSSEVDSVIADARVRAVTLTGSDQAGSAVGAAAGRHLKKTVLELGGSDPFIVLEDADLAAAAEIGAMARCQNAGQSCIAAKRFIVLESVADEFERRFVEAMAALPIGNPLDRATVIGPLAREDLREQVERQIRESVEQGARVVLGGERLPRPGYFFAPTILTHITRSMPVWREETFGPVAAVMRVKDVDEAIEMGNDSVYGLGASLWTADLTRARHLVEQIQAGSVFINGMVASDPRLPFGGIKRSGYGRELGEFGIYEFANIKTVWIGPAGDQASPRTPSE
jgi:succinate-semialdehyde dehydrogenase/glutarate-semialdehyde dehydrogenase